MVTGTLTVGFEVYQRLQIMPHLACHQLRKFWGKGEINKTNIFKYVKSSEAIQSHVDEIFASITD